MKIGDIIWVDEGLFVYFFKREYIRDGEDRIKFFDFV